jgi:DNA-binding MarR family transcriptional regulator
MAKEKGASREASNRDLLVAETPEQGAFIDIVRAASRLEGELNRMFRPFDLTTATHSILSILERIGGDGLSCGDIATQLIAEVPDMTRLLDRLEKLEYVVRERSALDRRMVKVKITDRGRQVVDGLRNQVHECHKRQFAAVDAAKISELRSTLKLLGREGGEASPPPLHSEENAKRHVGM